MKQYEAVIKAMEENGGYATLGSLYQNVLKVPGVEWKTKTPFATIRRIVQDERFFFKIKPGLWALNSFRGKLPPEMLPVRERPRKQQVEFHHAYYQGLLVEVGNLKKYQTFVPYQDKNKNFLGKKLADITSIREFYEFGYDHIIHRAQTVDVSWFNQRKMPSMLFEVEHSTDIQNSLLKFVELQDFYVEFFIVADDARRREYEHKTTLSAFTPIQRRTKFLSYEQVSEWHAKTYEIVSLENNIVFKI